MTPLERAARAVDGLIGVGDQLCATPEEVARAVLTAIREPSSDMLGDVHDTLLYHISGQELDTARLVWDRFIEVLLEGGE